MKLIVFFFVMASAFGLAANTKNHSGPIAVTYSDSALPPVETRKPNSDYRPAFPGQTRINGARTRTAYKVERIAEKMGRPWAIVPLPDGRFLTTEKSGFLQLYSPDGKFLKKITGLPAVDDGGQGGLLDVAPDPAFAKNRIIYWSFSERYDNGNLLAVAKGKLSTDETTIEGPIVIFRATPALNSSLHFGSRIEFNKNGNLFVSTGERSILEGRKQAPWLNSHLGKIFHITQDGKPAPGNPFVNNKDAMPEIYAYGIRNAQSLALHPVTGDLWEAEFGPRGGDELNLIRAGKNYGWPTITYGLEYSGRKVGDGIQQKEGMEQPIYYWDPVLSPSGMTFYAGNAIPEWKNNLFIGGLSGHLCRLVIANNKVTGEERIMEDKHERVRDVAYHNGMLYVVTDSGNMYRISKQ